MEYEYLCKGSVKKDRYGTQTYVCTEVSLAAANIDRIRTVVKRARCDIDKVDNEKVDQFKVIALFPNV